MPEVDANEDGEEGWFDEGGKGDDEEKEEENWEEKNVFWIC